MLELGGQLALEEPGDDVLDQLLVGLGIEADRVLVVRRKLFGAIFIGALKRDFGIGVDSLYVRQSLFIAEVQVALSLNLDSWLIIFDLRVNGANGDCFSCGSSLLWRSLLGADWLLFAAEQEFLHVVLDLLGALVVFGVIEFVRETDEAVVLITEEVEEVNEQLLGHLGWEALFLLSQLLPDWKL